MEERGQQEAEGHQAGAEEVTGDPRVVGGLPEGQGIEVFSWRDLV